MKKAQNKESTTILFLTTISAYLLPLPPRWPPKECVAEPEPRGLLIKWRVLPVEGQFERLPPEE